MKSIKVLSIDGGGIYGLTSAMILAELETLTGKPIAHLFDFIAGTSTGGILALGLTVPGFGKKPKYTAQDAVALYTNHSKDIFYASLGHKIRALGNILDCKYPATGIDRVLHRYFGYARLSELIIPVLIPSYDTESRNPYFFKSNKADDIAFHDYYVRDVARGTSAAPSYFPPARITSIDKTETLVLIDGSVVADDPAMCAYAEVKTLYPECEQIFLLSLSSTGAKKPYPYEKIKHWGAPQWLGPTLDIIGEGAQQTIDYQLQHLFMANQHEHNTYDRIVVPTLDPNIAIDDARPSSIRLLTECSQRYIEQNAPLLKKIAEQLMS